MGESAPSAKKDLHRIARHYLDGDVEFAAFRLRMLRCWEELSRMALSATEREAWSEFVMALRSTHDDDSPVGGGALLYDEHFFREALPALLEMDASARRPPRVKRAREIQESIGEVLLNQWDPIGVKDVPEAADEYDSYVGGIYRLLASGASDQEIARHLSRIEAALMGLGTNVDDLLPVAERLRAVDIAL